MEKIADLSCFLLKMDKNLRQLGGLCRDVMHMYATHAITPPPILLRNKEKGAPLRAQRLDC